MGDISKISWENLKEELERISLILHPLLKRRFQLFATQNPKELTSNYISRIISQAELAHIDQGLSKSEIITVAIMCGLKDGVNQRKSILEFYRDEDFGPADLI